MLNLIFYNSTVAYIVFIPLLLLKIACLQHEFFEFCRDALDAITNTTMYVDKKTQRNVLQNKCIIFTNKLFTVCAEETFNSAVFSCWEKRFVNFHL